MDVVVKQGKREAEVRLEPTTRGWHVEVDGRVYDIDATVVADGLHSLVIEGRQYEVAVELAGDAAGGCKYRVSRPDGAVDVDVMDPLAYLAQKSHGSAGGGGAERVTAYMPGRVTKILVAEGDQVAAGQGILVLEAMKMENEIQAENDGVVAKILVEEGAAVEGGDPLFELGSGEA